MASIFKPALFATLSLSATLLAVSPQTASADEHGYYLGLRAIGAFSEITGISGNNFSNALDIRNDTDEVGAVGGFVGYKWINAPLHSELELTYRTRFDFDTRDDGPLDNDIGYEANVATTAVLFNLLYDFRNSSRFTPYVGGTLGWARNSSETERLDVKANTLTKTDNDSDNLAWGLMTGVIWDLNSRWGADLAYRYIDLGEVDTGSLAGGDSVTADDYVSHDLIFSVFYRF